MQYNILQKLIFFTKLYLKIIFILECDLSKQPLDRSLLLQSLGLKESENSTKLPLLCNIVETFKNLKST